MTYLTTILRRYWLPLLGFNLAVIGTTYYGSTYYQHTFVPHWTAQAKLNVPYSPANHSTVEDEQESEKTTLPLSINPLKLQSDILISNEVLKRILASDSQSEKFPTSESYRHLFKVTLNSQSTTIDLKTKGNTPEIAQKRLTEWLTIYQQRVDELRREDVQVRQKTVETEQQKALVHLEKAQKALNNFKQQTGLFDPPKQKQGLLTVIHNLKAEQTRLLAESRASQSQAQSLSGYLGMQPRQAVQALRLAQDKQYQALNRQLAEVETQIAQTKGNYTNAHPRLQRLISQREQLRQQKQQRFRTILPNPTGIDTSLGTSAENDSRLNLISKLLTSDSDTQRLHQKAEQMNQQITLLNQELEEILRNEDRLMKLQNNYEVAQTTYKNIATQIDPLRLNPFVAYPNLQILDRPTVSDQPSQSQHHLIELSGLLVVLLGSLGIILRGESRKPILRPQDLQKVEMPVLVKISRLKQPNVPLLNHEELEFQRLAAVVQSMMLEGNRLMVTSATFGEGKTTVTLGLALALTNLGFRVLLVDGDWQRRELTHRMGALPSANMGLTPVKVGLDLLPAPDLDPEIIGEFCIQGGFEAYLEQAEQFHYDYVLVDSAPVSLTVEPMLMSAIVNNILFVVRSGYSDRFSAIDSFKLLQQRNVRMVGVVVNDLDSPNQSYRYAPTRSLAEAY